MLRVLRRTTLFLLFTSALTNCDTCPKCKQIQTYGMRGVDCYSLDLVEIPQCFRSDIEVLELSHNRLRRITANDLSKYKNLKILYLDDNMIMNVDENAFAGKTSLEILDISSNSFVKIPPNIFNLPSLNKLYFSHNQNTNIVQNIGNLKPILSPLIYLELAFDDLPELPDLGLLPTLHYFNITGNAHIKLNASRFAGICNLKVFYNNNTTVLFDDPCECWTLQRWLEGRDVEFYPFNCLNNIDTCDSEIAPSDIEIFEDCRRDYEKLIMKERMLYIVLPICILTLLLLIIIIVIICIKRRRVKRSRTTPKSKIIEEERNRFVK